MYKKVNTFHLPFYNHGKRTLISDKKKGFDLVFLPEVITYLSVAYHDDRLLFFGVTLHTTIVVRTALEGSRRSHLSRPTFLRHNSCRSYTSRSHSPQHDNVWTFACDFPRFWGMVAHLTLWLVFATSVLRNSDRNKTCVLWSPFYCMLRIIPIWKQLSFLPYSLRTETSSPKMWKKSSRFWEHTVLLFPTCLSWLSTLLLLYTLTPVETFCKSLLWVQYVLCFVYILAQSLFLALNSHGNVLVEFIDVVSKEEIP